MSQPRRGPEPGHVTGFEAYARALATGEISDTGLLQMLDFIDARLDLSDHRLLILINLLIVGGSELPPTLRDDIERTIVGFKYDLSEPGSDSMCYWSENHIVVFATCEYLAGQLFGERTFTNDGRKGDRHRASAASRLTAWLADRFRFGFSEWLSNTYYELDIAALSMLVDHAADPELVRQATMVLDLMFLDMAQHRFGGRFLASSGRAYSEQKRNPAKAEVNMILDTTFGTAPGRFAIERISSVFLTRTGYVLPQAIRDIALDDSPRRVTTSQGLDLDEVAEELRRHPTHPRTALPDLARFFWSAGAVTTRESIAGTMGLIKAHDLWDNRFLSALGQFRRLPRAMWVPTQQSLNPITGGTALQRANVLTYRTHDYLLSSAQHYHPGDWGDQQSLWVAALPGDIAVFGTHPGASSLNSEVRPTTPSHWVGNGINPHIAQRDNVLLALHDLRGRKGFFEGKRQLLSHVHFPFVKFDDTRLGPRFVVGRRGGAYIAIISLEPLEMVSETELVQRGSVTGYAVIMADITEYPSLLQFANQIKKYPLSLRGDTMSLWTPDGRYDLRWRRGLRFEGRRVDAWYPRYDSDQVQAPRNPNQITVNGHDSRLELDWLRGVRSESPN